MQDFSSHILMNWGKIFFVRCSRSSVKSENVELKKGFSMREFAMVGVMPFRAAWVARSARGVAAMACAAAPRVPRFPAGKAAECRVALNCSSAAEPGLCRGACWLVQRRL